MKGKCNKCKQEKEVRGYPSEDPIDYYCEDCYDPDNDDLAIVDR